MSRALTPLLLLLLAVPAAAQCPEGYPNCGGECVGGQQLLKMLNDPAAAAASCTPAEMQKLLGDLDALCKQLGAPPDTQRRLRELRDRADRITARVGDTTFGGTPDAVTLEVEPPAAPITDPAILRACADRLSRQATLGQGTDEGMRSAAERMFDDLGSVTFDLKRSTSSGVPHAVVEESSGAAPAAPPPVQRGVDPADPGTLQREQKKADDALKSLDGLPPPGAPAQPAPVVRPPRKEPPPPEPPPPPPQEQQQREDAGLLERMKQRIGHGIERLKAYGQGGH